MTRYLLTFTCVVILTNQICAQVRGSLQDPKTQVRFGEGTADGDERTRERREAAEKELASARAYITEEKWLEGRRSLDSAMRFAVDDPQRKQITALYKELASEAQRQLDEAKSAYEKKKYAEAIEAFARIGSVFGRAPAAVKARRAIEEAEHDPDARSAAQDHRASMQEKLIEKMLSASDPHPTSAPTSQPASQPTSNPTSNPTSAPTRLSRIKRLPLPRQLEIMERLKRISSKFPDTPAGKRAADDVEAMKADEAYMASEAKLRRAHQAQRALKKAEMYEKAGLTAKAVRYYEELIEDFPNTPEAAKAKAKLTVVELQK